MTKLLILFVALWPALANAQTQDTSPLATQGPTLVAPLEVDLLQPEGSAPETGTQDLGTNGAVPQPQIISAQSKAVKFLKNGGPSIWAIATLSLITLALILWKMWRFALLGAWSKGSAGKAVTIYESGSWNEAQRVVAKRRGIRSKVVFAAIKAVQTLPEDKAREETARVAKRELAQASKGLRALELIATIAPLLGLLGTVLGMIAAFQALQNAGSRADPAVLAGGIWEALLTTAAGMAVAIPASAFLTWFESLVERIRQDVEDHATRIFVKAEQPSISLAAE